MPELREVFDMVTKQVEPDRDSWKDQERRQRRVARNRRIGGLSVVALLAVAAVVLILTLRNTGGGGGTPSATHPPSSRTSQGPSSLPSDAPGPVVVGLDGAARAAVPNVPPTAESMIVSPDGRTVAFSTGTRLATISIDGTGLRYVTPETGHVGECAWSPDGSKIACQRNRHLIVVAADGSGLTQLTSGAGTDQWPSWSPDGSTIVYSNSGARPLDRSGFSNTQEIFTVPAAGGAATRFTHNSTWDDMPAYSPDGTRIAFSDDGSIWIVGVDGTHAHPLPGQPSGPNFNPRWSPDGSRIVLITYYDRARAADGGPLLTIHVVDVSTGATSHVRGMVEADSRAPAWMPAGDALLVDRYGG
jgi:Tol biopolymer transport system component